jgi:hypothetical protein
MGSSSVSRLVIIKYLFTGGLRKYVILVPYAIIICTLHVSAKHAVCETTHKAKEKQSPKIYDAGLKCWQEIQDLEPIVKLGKGPDTLGYWKELGIRSSAIFWTTIAGPMDKESLHYFIKQFGKHGAEADIRWVLTNPVILLPYSEPSPYQYSGNDPNLKIFNKRVMFLNQESSKYLVELFLDKPDLLDRYYHMLIWSGRYLGWSDESQNFKFEWRHEFLRKEFAGKAHPEHFWWKCREFILMAHATGRDDLWIDSKPEEYPKICVKWIHWMKLQYHFLEPHPEKPIWYRPPNEKAHLWMKSIKPLKIPAQPFPDYSGPKVPHPDVIFDFVDNWVVWFPGQGVLVDEKPPAEWLADWVNERCHISPATQPGNEKKR